jgi:hypothetical protein
MLGSSTYQRLPRVLKSPTPKINLFDLRDNGKIHKSWDSLNRHKNLLNDPTRFFVNELIFYEYVM